MNLTSFVWFRMESGHWPTVCKMDDVQPILDGHVFYPFRTFGIVRAEGAMLLG